MRRANQDRIQVLYLVFSYVSFLISDFDRPLHLTLPTLPPFLPKSPIFSPTPFPIPLQSQFQFQN